MPVGTLGVLENQPAGLSPPHSWLNSHKARSTGRWSENLSPYKISTARNVSALTRKLRITQVAINLCPALWLTGVGNTSDLNFWEESPAIFSPCLLSEKTTFFQLAGSGRAAPSPSTSLPRNSPRPDLVPMCMLYVLRHHYLLMAELVHFLLVCCLLLTPPLFPPRELYSSWLIKGGFHDCHNSFSSLIFNNSVIP